MKIVGSRLPQAVCLSPSGAALLAGARFNDEIHRLPTGQTTHIPKGVYRFKSHAQANQFDQACLARHMANIALERERLHPVRTVDMVGLLKTKMTARDKDVADRMVLERALQARRLLP